MTDINRHFSGPVFAMVIAKRRAEQSPPARYAVCGLNPAAVSSGVH